MKLSIIVPVYNAEKYLKRCIDSILAQTFTDYELMLIDDGSTDSSGLICDEYAESDGRIKVIHTENRGVASARNSAIDEALGEYTGFVDADDYIEPDMYERLISTADNNGADVVCCGYVRHEGNAVYEKRRPENIDVVLEGRENIFREYLRQDYDNGFGDGNWNKVFRKSVTCDVRYKNYTNGEDIDFQIDVFKRAGKVVLIPDMLYHYMCNPNTATTKSINEGYFGVLNIADSALEYALRELPEVATYAYAFHLAWYMDVLMKIYETRNDMSADTATYMDRIKENVKSNYKYYKSNEYAKRLDKALARAMKYKCVFLLLDVRKMVKNK